MWEQWPADLRRTHHSHRVPLLRLRQLFLTYLPAGWRGGACGRV